MMISVRNGRTRVLVEYTLKNGKQGTGMAYEVIKGSSKPEQVAQTVYLSLSAHRIYWEDAMTITVFGHTIKRVPDLKGRPANFRDDWTYNGKQFTREKCMLAFKGLIQRELQKLPF